MEVAAAIQKCDEALGDLARRFGIERQVLLEGEGQGEGRDRVNWLVENADLSSLARIEQVHLERWFEVFGDALAISCEVIVTSGSSVPPPPWRATNAGHDRVALQPLLDHCQLTLGRAINVTARLHKTGEPWVDKLRSLLVDMGFVDAGGATVWFFFSGRRLETILSQIKHLSGEDFLAPSGTDALPVLVLVADTPGRILGPHLAVLGQQIDEQSWDETWKKLARVRAAGPPAEALGSAREVMNRVCNWDGRPRLLTPDLLRTSPRGVEGFERCRQELVRLLNGLSIAYVANRTSRSGGEPLCSFEGERTVDVKLESEDRRLAPYRLYRWAYAERESAPTRIDIARRVVASMVPAAPGSFRTLVAKGLQLLAECKVQLRVLIKRNLVDSFQRRQEVARIVRSYADEVGERTRSLAKETVDHTYRTVGVVVGVVVAYLLKPDRGPLFLAVGSLLYFVYLAFVRWFYLEAIRQDFETKKAAFADESARIQESQLVAPGQLFAEATATNAAFDARFRTVSRIYSGLLLMALLVLAGSLVALARGPSPETVRTRAVEGLGEHLAGLGYRHVRLDVGERAPPELLTDVQGRKTAAPDLAAVKPDGTLVVVAYLPCEAIGKARALKRLKALFAAATQRGGELHGLVSARCGSATESAALRHWLEQDGIQAARVWYR